MPFTQSPLDEPIAPRPLIVPAFIPHAGCPHRCVFCNQTAVTGQTDAAPDFEKVLTRASGFLRFRSGRRKVVQIAFFGGNFLGLPAERIQAMLAATAEWMQPAEVNGIRFSTRPDTVNPRTLDLIAGFPVKTVELGAQSMNDKVLRLSRRGHTATDTSSAVERLQAGGYEVGLQIMVGLPGDDRESLMETGRRIADLKPDFVRIYPTVVLAGSLLESWYHAGRYRPLTVADAVALTAPLYRLFRQGGIPVIRTGLQLTQDLVTGGAVVAGPLHPAFGHLVQSACFLDAARNALSRSPVSTRVLEIHVHPRSISRMRGLRNGNGAALMSEFGFSKVTVLANAELPENTVALPNGDLISVYCPAEMQLR
jgi:histone acetyltransferase (RNA polymerase elongator complex component)